MGVTLERVQYKFASIIGELCSEPFVLSQFAVWLDLKLAEYKSKGCISLDCCGSLPEPDWLKGLKQAWDETKIAESAKGAGDLGDSFFSLSKDTNNVGTKNTGSDQNLSSYNKTDSEPVRHTDQRLSINRTEMAIDYSDNDVVLVEDELLFEKPMHRTPASIPTGDMYSRQYRPTASLQNRPVSSRDSLHGVSPYHINSSARRSRSHPHSSQNNTGKRNSTARNIAAAVGHLRKWLIQEPRLDRRDILEIPTQELDTYLADFFMAIKKASGENYTKRSFEVCRYSLERYLKQHKYPYSICKSPEFSKCQHSFHARKQSLPDTADWSYMYTPANRQSTGVLSATAVGLPDTAEVDSSGGPLQVDHQQTQDFISDLGNSGTQFHSALTPITQTGQNDVEQNITSNITGNDDNMTQRYLQQQHSEIPECSDIRLQEELTQQSVKPEML